MPDKTTALYTIGIAAELLKVHPRTLRLYEERGLIKPARRNNRRLYSNHDLAWVRCIRHLIHEKKGLNQEGLRRLLALIPCWEIKQCPPARHVSCSARHSRRAPCWHLIDVSCDDRHCPKCAVYLAAPQQVCSPKELAELYSYHD